MTATCPQCGRPSRGRAFPKSPLYLRCALGHVWHRDRDED